jgi:glycosyltransferase involved in cell wall biosynthesis
MNVLFAYAFCGLGGVETAVLNRCTALRSRGIDSTVFFGQFYGDGGRRLADLSHVRVGLEHLPEILQQAIDVVCVIDYPDFVPIVRREAPHAALLLETHASITTRLIDFHRLTDDPTVAGVIVPSEFNRNLLLRVSEGRQPIHVVPNGIDTEQFRPLPLKELSGHFGALTAKTIVLWVGRLEDEKNPQGFVRLARQVRETHRNIHFICIGDAPQDPGYRRRLEEDIRDDTRRDHTFISTVPPDEMPLYYSLAAATGGCLVSTSRFEAVPMIFLEAMACGCPVVSSRVGGVTDILADGLTAELFDLDDEPSALRAVDNVINAESRPHRTHVVAGALAYVRDHHSLQVLGDRFSCVLHSALDSTRGAAPPPG